MLEDIADDSIFLNHTKRITKEMVQDALANLALLHATLWDLEDSVCYPSSKNINT